MLPLAFRSQRALERLNVVAVGAALAAVAAAAFTLIFLVHKGIVPYAVGGSTWIIGMLWAVLLRRKETLGRTSLRLGFVASVPLAILNAAVSSGVLAGAPSFHLENVVVGAIMGATFGALFWVPSLIATIVCFGLPIAHAQRLAEKGLAGEERGERVVGLVCVLMSLVALGVLLDAGGSFRGIDGLWFVRSLAVLGLATGGAAARLAEARGRRRKVFVRDAEAGKVPGYRVDETDEGKVLVRVVAQGKGYRVADFEEDVLELDAHGDAITAEGEARKIKQVAP